VPPGQYVSSICSGNSDYAYAEITTCQSGEYEMTPADPGSSSSPGSDASCSTCSEPVDGQYVHSICNSNNDTVIETATICLDGEYEAAPTVQGSSSQVGSDRVCALLTTTAWSSITSAILTVRCLKFLSD
jgi:hypothetical protein